MRACLVAMMHIVALTTGAAARGDEILTLRHQGVERTAVLFRQPAREPRPLVIALHGLGGNPAILRHNLNMDAVARREGFAVVYPEALQKIWNYGSPFNRPAPAIDGMPVDDVGFIGLLAGILVEQKLADPARIYVTGTSLGGLMAFTLACALSDRVVAAALLIAAMTAAQREECHPVRRMALMLLAGTEDRRVPFSGKIGSLGRLVPVPETIDYWRTLNGCTTSETASVPHRDDNDPTRLVSTEWTDCVSGAPTRFYRVDGGGHRVPSLRPYDGRPGEEHANPRNRDIDTAEAVWDFFKPLALPVR